MIILDEYKQELNNHAFSDINMVLNTDDILLKQLKLKERFMSS